MFGLIPMVITIILAAIVAGAFAYFGGDIYSDSSISAKANGYVNEGSQIRSAAQLYRVTNASWPTDVATLVTETFLGGSPAHVYTIDGTNGKIGAIQDTLATEPNFDLSAEVCGKIQDASVGDLVVPTAEPANQLFGCWLNVSAHTFFHK